MTHPKFRHGLLAAALAALLAPAPAVFAQSNDEPTTQRSTRAGASDRSRDKAGRDAKQEQPESQFPNAMREAPEAKGSSKMASKLQKLVKQYEADKPAEARALADEIIADAKANTYDRAFAAQVGAQAAFDTDDTAAAMRYLNQVVESNGLDNNSHYGALLTLAQLQLQEDQLEPGLATLDRFFAETKSQKPEHLIIKGNALYQLERYQEAVPVLKQAIEASPEPKNDWLQLLMSAYIETEQTAEAAKVAEAIAAKSPNDKRAQTNLAIVYMQSDMNDKAVAILEKLRAAGQLTEEKEYRNLYATYYNMDGKQKEVIDVVNEGLQKNILKPDYQTYIALAQAHYELEQIGPAIEAFKKAAPLATDGQTYLNLANLLWQESRIGEAKEAARQALAKGLKNPASAQKIIALPGK